LPGLSAIITVLRYDKSFKKQAAGLLKPAACDCFTALNLYESANTLLNYFHVLLPVGPGRR